MISCKDRRYICALDPGFEQIREKWKAVILCHREGPKRVLALQHMTGGISQKVLNESLREMEEELIHRKVYPEIPPRVEHSLTEKGRKTCAGAEDHRILGQGVLSAVGCGDRRILKQRAR